MQLRCTLMGHESGYPIKIPSKQLIFNKFSFSTRVVANSIFNLNPWFVTGFYDGEGSFIISITKNKNTKLGWLVRPFFSIGLGKNELPLLLQLQQFFGGVGTISKSNTYNRAIYSVSSINDLTNVIIPHFEKYPLLTQKAADFILFKQVLDLMNEKAHLSIEGISKIINIKSLINLGLSEIQKSDFSLSLCQRTHT